MSNLFTAVNNMTTTDNGMVAYKSTLNPLVDLFLKIGASRDTNLNKEFGDALVCDKDKALRILLWARDIRGGAGERKRFRDMSILISKFLDKETMLKVIDKIPEIGRFDDLHVFVGTDYEQIALNTHIEAIKAGNGLAAKWAPRKGDVAVKMRELWGVTPKFYRKTIVGLTNVVEQKMCSDKWEEIEFSHVPSQASRIYANAFKKHEEQRYTSYLEKVMTGEEKMNASATFPHEILRGVRSNAQQADAQWKSLPNYLEGVNESILTVCDVSGSMSGTPMDISIALGLYFSERIEGIFKDCVITFSERPKLMKLSGGTLSQRMLELSRVDWGMSTNFEAVFDTVLDAAKRHNLLEKDMPTKILVLTDMQFNQAGNFTAFEMVQDKYSQAGYKMPQLVFWNINGGNSPVTFNQKGVGLVSGSSPATIKAVLGGDIDPVKVMEKAIMQERYSL